MKMMEKAGYAKRGESDAGEEWITVDEDGSDLTKDKMKDALAGYVRCARLFFLCAEGRGGKGVSRGWMRTSLPSRGFPKTTRVALRLK